MHPIINVLQNAETFITPMAARILCHQAYINKVNLEEVDQKVLDICRSVQKEIRILAGDAWSNTDPLEEMMSCANVEEYLDTLNNVETDIGVEIVGEAMPFFQFLVAFGLNFEGEYHRAEVTIPELVDVFARFGNKLLEITDDSVPVHNEDPVMI